MKNKLVILNFTLIAVLFFSSVNAQSVDDLKNKIDERTEQIKKLEQEIKQYNIEVNNAVNQAKTLTNTIKTLDLSKKKIVTDISLTEKKIDKTSLSIKQISSNIDETESKINVSKLAIAKAIKATKEAEDNSLVVSFLSSRNISELWEEFDSSQKVNDLVREKIIELDSLKKDMEVREKELFNQKDSLLDLKEDLSGKKKAVEYTVKEKASVLTETKNKEQIFKTLVKEKQEQKTKFERELFDFESQLNILIDKSSYPGAKKGVLSWPLDDVYITQGFGKTVGAEKLYKSGSHNGIDLRASIGTRVKNVLSGTVVGTGNTDVPGCYSFGKWVMVRHDNGLSTIYGHLSVISAVTGQRLNTGDLIGLSGNTGYSTGPHLHISVYATQGVRIEKYVNSVGCKNVVLPIADVKAYLDPLAYFPPL